MTKQHVWARTLDIALFVLTLASVATSFVDGLPDWTTMAVLTVFVAMFFMRWRIADDRAAWMKSNWFDLVVVVLLSSPVLRMLMALRLVHLLPALRLGVLFHANKARLLRLLVLSGDSLPAALALVFGIVFVFGTSTYLLEHSHNPQFGVLQDGLWWAFVTLTTVGYGDIYPITAAGRIVAVITMIFGIVVYSLVIANVTVFLENYTAKQNALKESALKESALKESALQPSSAEPMCVAEIGEQPESEKQKELEEQKELEK